jgi:signal transduction histidine kinase
MINTMEYLGKRSKTSLMVLGFVLLVLIGGIDYLTGPELSCSIFYLIPISLVAWFVGRRAGILMSIVGATMWLIADLLAGHPYSYPAIPYWNAMVRLGFFLIVVYVMSILQASRKRQRELVGFIIHDLRTPLTLILTGLQLLQEIGSKTMDETQQALINSGITSGNRMLILINSLLDLSRLESGQMPLQIGEVSVKELVRLSLEQVDLWARRNRDTLTAQLNTEIESVQADRELAVRILVNLLSNAIKFSPPESTISVRVAPAEVNMLAFSVIDQGPGIPKEWIEKVFDKFTQVEAHRAGATVGSGLGLNFCRLAVEAQGGRIWLESEAGKGTTITFTLPVAAQ